MKILSVASILIIFCSCGKYDVIHHGCTSPAVNERFEGGFLFMPNIFSPNGDLHNDFLDIWSKGISSIYIKIDNGLGVSLFESNKQYTSADSVYVILWNGWNKSGHTEPIDNYKYLIDYTTFGGVSKSIKGKITIVASVAKNQLAGVNCIDNYGDCVFGDQWDYDGDSLNLAVRTSEPTAKSCN